MISSIMAGVKPQKFMDTGVPSATWCSSSASSWNTICPSCLMILVLSTMSQRKPSSVSVQTPLETEPLSVRVFSTL